MEPTTDRPVLAANAAAADSSPTAPLPARPTSSSLAPHMARATLDFDTNGDHGCHVKINGNFLVGLFRDQLTTGSASRSAKYIAYVCEQQGVNAVTFIGMKADQATLELVRALVNMGLTVSVRTRTDTGNTPEHKAIAKFKKSKDGSEDSAALVRAAQTLLGGDDHAALISSLVQGCGGCFASGTPGTEQAANSVVVFDTRHFINSVLPALAVAGMKAEIDSAISSDRTTAVGRDFRTKAIHLFRTLIAEPNERTSQLATLLHETSGLLQGGYQSSGSTVGSTEKAQLATRKAISGAIRVLSRLNIPEANYRIISNIPILTLNLIALQQNPDVFAKGETSSEIIKTHVDYLLSRSSAELRDAIAHPEEGLGLRNAICFISRRSVRERQATAQLLAQYDMAPLPTSGKPQLLILQLDDMAISGEIHMPSARANTPYTGKLSGFSAAGRQRACFSASLPWTPPIAELDAYTHALIKRVANLAA